jgi:hypothetical protein
VRLDPALKRNVTDALPERTRARARTAMNQAHATRDPKRAPRLLENLAHKSESAIRVRQLRCAKESMRPLTVMALHLLEGLGRVLASTNLIKEPVQPGPRGRETRQTLAGRNHDPALDRRRACSKPNTTSAKSPNIGHCRDWPPQFTLVRLRFTAHAELIIESRQPK